MPLKLIDLCSIQGSEAYELCRSQDLRHDVIRLKTSLGWRMIDSPYAPRDEVCAVLNARCYQGAHVIVLGLGSGFLLSELCGRGAAHMLVITASRELGSRNAELLKSRGFQEQNITIVVADSLGNQLISLTEIFCKAAPGVHIVVHPRETRAFPLLYSSLAVLLESIKRPFVRPPLHAIQRAALTFSGQLVEPEILKELQKRDIEVIPLDPYVDKTIEPSNAWNVLQKVKPDIFISTNNKAADRFGLIPQACQQAGVPWITWFLDDPRFIVKPTEMAASQQRYVFCWDSSGIDACRALGITRAALLPLATDPTHFAPGCGDDTLRGRIVYVGRPSFGNEERYFAGLVNNPDISAVASHFEPWIWEQRRMPPADDIESALIEHNLQNCLSAQAVSRLPAYFLYRANLNYRVAALSALADLRPIVYGDGWQGILPSDIELRSSVDYYRDLAIIYRSDAVHLSLTHLQMRHYPNQRIFDVGACGNLVLGERLSGWSDLFSLELDEIFFDDFDQLKSKAACLAANRDRRHHFGEMLRYEIVKRHTYAHRLDKIFESINNT